MFILYLHYSTHLNTFKTLTSYVNKYENREMCMQI